MMMIMTTMMMTIPLKARSFNLISFLHKFNAHTTPNDVDDDSDDDCDDDIDNNDDDDNDSDDDDDDTIQF